MRKIFHLDLDAFFCAVEEQRHPELVGRPFAVGGRPEARGVISSCSYAARAFGVRSAMPTSQALKICPGLIVLPGRHANYAEKSRQVMAILYRYTALIEQVSIDEAFLDLSDVDRPAEALARELQGLIASEQNLPCSLGVASNKLVAKMATDIGKSRHRGNVPPRSILVVPFGTEKEFLAPLPVQSLWGVGKKTAERLEHLGVHTIGDLAATSERFLVKTFGKYGHDLWLHAQGIDDRPVETEHSIKSISQETTFERDIRDAEELRRTLREQSEQVSFRLRKDGLVAGTVRVKIRWPDFSLQSRQFTLPQATDVDGVIRGVAVDLFERLWAEHNFRPVRLIGVGVSGLSEKAYQLSLLDSTEERERHLLEAMDSLRSRFGENIVRRADTLKPKKKP